MSARLRSDLWVAAYRKHLEILNIPCMVVAKGQASSGAVMVKLNTLDGKATALQRSVQPDGTSGWMVVSEGDERDVDHSISKQLNFDPDLWVLEVEDKAGRHLLDDPAFI
ncbi:MAG: DUF1491 family protein [Pseudomonadota bacterium]